MVGIHNPAVMNLSLLNIDADLAMGAHAITLEAGQTVDGKDVSELHMPRDLTAVGFQAITATGDAANPTNINNENTGTMVTFAAAGKYVELDFKELVKVGQYKLYGSASSNAASRVKIAYYNPGTHTWIDAKTGIVINSGAWSAWTALTTPFNAQKIRVICSAYTSAAYVGEMEMKA